VTTQNDRVAVIATAALTDDEIWTPFEPQSFLVFEDGRPVLKNGHCLLS